jgi:hypothetical protein
MFCAPGFFFDCAEGVESRFHVLRSRTLFRRYRGRQVSFSCCALPDSFSAEPSASGRVFMFCAPVLIFGGTEGVRSRFHILRSRKYFWRCGGRRLLFSCFALPESFSAEPWVSAPVFMFYASRLVFVGTEGVNSHFHILRAQTRFQRYRGFRVPLSSFARPDSFLAVLPLLGPVFKFCAPGHIFGDAEGVRCRFHVLRSRTYFRRYQGRMVPFSCFTRPNSFLAVPRASMFCAHGVVFGDNEGVGSDFHVSHSRILFRR